jgi:GH15 family glucan-1,4-alpha-glucosidase
MDGVFLYRYKSADGVPGSDGPSLLSRFMFVSCLALAGRADEAGDRLAELCSYASPLGLFAEQIDPAGQETAGNFPSAAVHAAAINAALYVGQARGRRVPTAHLLGTFTKAVQTSRRQAGV